MKRLLLATLILAPMVSFAIESKVICAEELKMGSTSANIQEVTKLLNKQISAEGLIDFTTVSAPTLLVDQDWVVHMCVTLTKP